MSGATGDPVLDLASRLLATLPAALGSLALLWLLERVLRARHPSVRPWTTAYALVLALLPLVGWTVPEVVRVHLAASESTLLALRPYAASLLVVWAVVAMLRVVRTLRRAARTERVVRTLACLGTEVRGERGTVVACPGDGVPFVAGFWRPRVVVPLDFLDGLSDAAARAALLHELAHARRRDPLRRLLARLLADVLWLNPLFACLLRRLEAGFEVAADRVALRQGASPRDLAVALVHACTRWGTARPGALVAPLGGSGSASLHERVAELRRPSGRARLLVAVLVAAAVLPWWPTPLDGPLARSTGPENQLSIGLGLGGSPALVAGARLLLPDDVLRLARQPR